MSNHRDRFTSNKYAKSKKLELQEKQAGRPIAKYCEVCGKDGKIVYDHDHKTGKFRGWICEDCNKALGFARDNPKTLILLSAYLKNSNGFIG